jgi:DNA-binding XRE family transcriptional regulator
MAPMDMSEGYHRELWALVIPLRDAMGERGRAQKQLARVAGVDRSTVSRWLSGRMLPPLKIAADLHADVEMVERQWGLAAEAMRDPQVRREAYLAGVHPRRAWSAIRTSCEHCGACSGPGAYLSGSWSAGTPGCAARRSGPCCAGNAALTCIS